MKLRHNQQGFSVFELILVVLVLALIGAVSVRYSNAHKTVASTSTANNTSPTPSLSSNASTVSTAPPVNSSTDLDKAEATLNQNNPETANGSDNSQLDSQLNGLN